MSESEQPFVRPPTALSSREAQLDPFPWYAEMRRDAPELWWNDDQHRWEAFTYDAVKSILEDYDRFSADTELPTDRMGILDDTIFTTDPPRHTELRNTVNDYFRPDNVAQFEPFVRDTTEALLDGVGDEATVDLVEEFAYALPILVIGKILGVPEDDRDQFRSWCRVLTQAQADAEDELIEEQMAVGQEMITYLMEIIEKRRADPQDDLITEFTQSTIDGEPLDVNEILGYTALLLVAGNITTTGLITNALWCYADHPESFEGYVDDEAGVRSLLEEVARYRSSVPAVSRVVAEDGEAFGRSVEAGDPVVVWVASANRDADRFDAPDEFRPGRSPNPHIGFGHGIHNCLGSALARLEARVAVSTLFDRFDVEILTDDLAPRWNVFMHGVERLPARLDG